MALFQPYVPILRWRASEMTALEKLYPKDRELIMPLIEFIMPPPKVDKMDRHKILENSKSKFIGQLQSVGKRLLKHSGSKPTYIDVHLLDGDIRASSFDSILSSAVATELSLIPVVHIIPVSGSAADIKTREVAVKYAKKSNNGLCIRIDKAHLKDEDLSDNIENFIGENNIDIKKIDILVDMQIVNQDTSAQAIVDKLSDITQLTSCRSFILSGGAFPKDLTDLQKFENYQLERSDWKLWQEVIKNKLLIRQPSFSDYTIQHPKLFAYIPIPSVSASVRYTNDEHWEVLRGEALNYINKKTKVKGPGHKQYLAHAREIIKQPFYKNDDFSFGDSDIARIATPGNVKTGNPRTWLTIGINHHLTLAARQNATLYEK